jgi:RNase H-fold protein (predicted Holliday junction resolvase)
LSSFEKKENIASKKDSMAALLILESYLEKIKKTN